MVCEKYLTAPDKIITEDIELPTSYMGGKVNVVWKSEDEAVLSSDGKVGDFEKAKYMKLSAMLSFDDEKKTIEYMVTVVPKTEVPYELTIHADREKVKISDTLYGLFYEDINNAADGGIYAELVITVHLKRLHIIHMTRPQGKTQNRQEEITRRSHSGLVTQIRSHLNVRAV